MNKTLKYLSSTFLALFTFCSVIAQPPNQPIRTEPGSTNSTGGNAGTTGGNGAWGPDTATSRPSTATNPSAGDVMAPDSSAGTVEGSGNFDDNAQPVDNPDKNAGTGWGWLGITGLAGLIGLTALNRKKRYSNEP